MQFSHFLAHGFNRNLAIWFVFLPLFFLEHKPLSAETFGGRTVVADLGANQTPAIDELRKRIEPTLPNDWISARIASSPEGLQLQIDTKKPIDGYYDWRSSIPLPRQFPNSPISAEEQLRISAIESDPPSFLIRELTSSDLVVSGVTSQYSDSLNRFISRINDMSDSDSRLEALLTDPSSAISSNSLAATFKELREQSESYRNNITSLVTWDNSEFLAPDSSPLYPSNIVLKTAVTEDISEIKSRSLDTIAKFVDDAVETLPSDLGVAVAWEAFRTILTSVANSKGTLIKPPNRAYGIAKRDYGLRNRHKIEKYHDMIKWAPVIGKVYDRSKKYRGTAFAIGTDTCVTAWHVCDDTESPSRYYIKFRGAEALKDRDIEYPVSKIEQAFDADGSVLDICILTLKSAITKEIPDSSGNTKRVPITQKECLTLSGYGFDTNSTFFIPGYQAAWETLEYVDASEVLIPQTISATTYSNILSNETGLLFVEKYLDGDINPKNFQSRYTSIKDTIKEEMEGIFLPIPNTSERTYSFKATYEDGPKIRQPLVGLICDTAGGFSGAPVIDKSLGNVIGIFVGGEPDKDSSGKELPPIDRASIYKHEKAIPASRLHSFLRTRALDYPNVNLL